MNDPTIPTRLLTLTFRCCKCSNRTGIAEAYVMEDGDMCCTRCLEANILDEVQMAVLMES
jgi:hypothetical protein